MGRRGRTVNGNMPRTYPTPKWVGVLEEESQTWDLPEHERLSRLSSKIDEVRSSPKLIERLSYRFKRDRKIKSALEWASRNWESYSKARRTAYRRRMSNPVLLAEIRKRSRERKRERMATEPEYALGCRLRCRVKNALKRCSKSKSTEALCGCSFSELKLRIESMFESGMTWDNWTKGDLGWHLDHRVPCSFFDLTDSVQQMRCFHYSNLQPMWGTENLSKGDKLT